MKNYLKVLLFGLLVFGGCAPAYVNKPSIVIAPNLIASNYKIAVLPTQNNGNPDKLIDYNVAGKFQTGLREIGFKVVNYQIIEGVMKDLGLDAHSKPSANQLKDIQEKMNCNAICLSSVDNTLIPAIGQAGVNAYGGSASTREEYYRPSSESLTIIDYTTFETLVEVHTRRNPGRSMSSDIVMELKKRFNPNQPRL